MIFDWTDFLSLAHELALQQTISSPLREAKLRTAISRAYYSAYCKSHNYLIKKGIQFPSPKEFKDKKISLHRFVINELHNFDPVSSEFLNDLLADRIQADYYNVLNFNLHNRTIKDIRMANEIIKFIEENPTSSGNP